MIVQEPLPNRLIKQQQEVGSYVYHYGAKNVLLAPFLDQTNTILV